MTVKHRRPALTVVALLVLATAALLLARGVASDAGAADGVAAAKDKDKLIVHNQISIGKGFVRTVYRRAPDGTPRMIGVTISEAAMESLPDEPRHDGNTCFDVNEDGTTNRVTECASGHERVLWFPELRGLPFQWMMFNWQPAGHGPPGVFDKPHFDLHYFIQDYIERNFIRTGKCGVLTNCTDFATAVKPVPPPYYPVGFGPPGVAARMGNHLADGNAPPLSGGAFTQAFAYGSYDAQISFWEPVVSTTWLREQKPKQDCLTIKWAPAVQLSGYYPHTTCARFREDEEDYLMSLEDFEYRQAPAAGAKAAARSAVAPARARAATAAIAHAREGGDGH